MLKKNEYVPPKVVARWFVNHADRDSGDAITPLKLQKLVYYAQAWFLANFDRPLFEEDFQAWAHGPANPALYAKYKGHRWDALPFEEGQAPPKEVRSFLAAMYEEYGQFSGKKLEKMTHEEDPWLEARGDLPPEAKSKTVISKLTMRNYYAARLGKEKIKKIRN